MANHWERELIQILASVAMDRKLDGQTDPLTKKVKQYLHMLCTHQLRVTQHPLESIESVEREEG